MTKQNVFTNEELYEEIKAEAKKYSKQKQFSKAFPPFALKMMTNLSDKEIPKAVEGLGSNDASIDGFNVDKQKKEINIYQFKTVENVDKISQCTNGETFAYLDEVPNKLMDKNYTDKHKNKKIREEIGPKYREYVKQGYKVILHLVCLCKASEQTLLAHPNIKFYSFDQIKDEWFKYKNRQKETKPREYTLDLSLQEIGKPAYNEYVANNKKIFNVVLSANELVNLREKFGHQIYDKNLRADIGNSKINLRIMESAEKNPESFYCFNNGVSIVCNKYKLDIKNQKITLFQPQIINGAQTVNSLHKTKEKILTKNKELYKSVEQAVEETLKHFKKIKIQCRIIENNDVNFAKTLTMSVNQQNNMRICDFYANEPEQIELKFRFAEFGYPYETKRGEIKHMELTNKPHHLLKMGKDDFKHWDKKLNIETIAKSHQSYLGKPGFGEANPTNILSSSTQEEYKKIFGCKASDITDEKVQDMIFAYNIWDSVKIQAKRYDNLIHLWKRLSLAPTSDLLEKFKENLRKIKFIDQETTEKIIACDSYDAMVSEVEKNLIAKYYLISRSSNMVTAIIKYIMDKNGYLEKFFTYNLFDNRKFIDEIVVDAWLGKIITDLIQPIYNVTREKERLSEETFYKRNIYFEPIKQQKSSEELKEMFPLEFPN